MSLAVAEECVHGDRTSLDTRSGLLHTAANPVDVLPIAFCTITVRPLMSVGSLGWTNGAGNRRTFEIRTVYDLFDMIEHKPALFLGEHSLSALSFFFNGYTSALMAHELDLADEEPAFGGFHDYVASHYQWRESTAGWRRIILKEAGGDEVAALDSFFSLLRAFRGRA